MLNPSFCEKLAGFASSKADLAGLRPICLNPAPRRCRAPQQGDANMSLSRRAFLFAGCAIAGAWAASPVSADDIANLKTQLQSILRARRPEDFAFINLVVAKVDAGDLPRPVVNAAFNYARAKKPYPYPYFEESMKRMARKVGVDLGEPSGNAP